MGIRDARSLPPVAQEDLRRKVIRAVKNGMRKGEASDLFGVSRMAIHKWLRRWEASGEAGLKARPRGRPREPRLKPYQAAITVRLITDRCPDQLKLPFALWTREAVAELIERRFGVRLSKWTVGRYLKRWGLTPQKPVRKAFEQDPEAVRQWLEKEYPAIRRLAKREGARIYWCDEMGVRSDHQAGTSYGLRGRTPEIPGTGKRFRCNMISAVTNRGHLAFMVFKKRFKNPVFLEFLRRLIRKKKRKVFLIVDKHPVHISKAVKRWAEQHKRKIRLFFLPSYSPELNPDELLNQDVKSNAAGRMRPQDLDEMLWTIRSYLHGTQRRPYIVKNYFLEEHVRYAAT